MQCVGKQQPVTYNLGKCCLSGTAEKDEVPTDQLRAISIVASSSLALHNPSQSVALPVPAMRTLAQRRADFQQEQQERRPLVQMWADALLDVAWNRAQQSAHYLTPAARPWEIITGPDGRLFKQVIVDVIEDFGQICDRVLVLANNYQVPLETFNGMHPERLANVILSRRDEFQRAYQGLREEIKVDFITGATTLKIQFAWPDASLGIY